MAIKICPECGGKVAGTRNDCPHCGYVFPETFKCPECGGDIPQNSNECPICGYVIGKTETKPVTKTTVGSAAILSENSLSYNGKMDGTFSVVQDYNDDDFLRELFISLARDSSTPSNIISDCAINSVVIKKVPYLVVDTDTQVEFSCSVGYDREEQYWEEVEKKDSQGNRYKEKELKTRTVTDWQPFNGTNSGSEIITVTNNNESYYCSTDNISIMTEIPYSNEDRALFGDIVPSPVALSVVADSAKRTCAESAKKPGDHQKDLSYHGTVNIKSVKAVVVPHFVGSYDYDGQKYAASGYAAGALLLSSKRPSIEESEKSIIKKKTRPTFIMSVILTVLMIAAGVVLEMLSMLGIFGNTVSNILMIVAGVLAVVFLVLIVLMWLIYFSIKKTLKDIFTFVRQAQKIKDIHQEFTKRGWQFLTEGEFNSICSPELVESTQKTVIRKTDQLPFSKRLGIHYKNYVLSRALKLCRASEDDNDYTSDSTAPETGKRKKRRKTGKIVTAVVSVVLVVALGLGLGLGFGLGSREYTGDWNNVIIDKKTGLVYRANGANTCQVNSFDKNSKVTSVIVPTTVKGRTVTALGVMAFNSCSNLGSVVLPETITSIGNSSFIDCTNLVSITIPYSLKSIPSGAFERCDNLKAVIYTGDIESWCDIDGLVGLMSIQTSSFSILNPELYIRGNRVEGELVIPDTVKEIKASAFNGCSDITSIKISESVTSIGTSAFGGCSGLTSVTIGNSVTSIGYSAFDMCYSLTTVFYKGTIDDWDEISIDYANDYLEDAMRYYYSETEPTTSGNYWHYDKDGVTPVEW